MTKELGAYAQIGDQSITALLVIDVQQGLFERSTPIYNAEQVLVNINMLVRSARREGVPVFFIQHANKSTLVAGSDAWRLHPQIQPLDTERIIHKRQGNAFKETALREELLSKGIERLVITGLVTHGCVKATCIGAMELGYHVVLIEDGHSNFSKQADQLIEKWNRKLGELGIELKRARAVDFSKGTRQNSETA